MPKPFNKSTFKNYSKGGLVPRAAVIYTKKNSINFETKHIRDYQDEPTSGVIKKRGSAFSFGFSAVAFY